jgi:diadenosine tetraphosphate (Ap4A) HIT family hydrolase
MLGHLLVTTRQHKVKIADMEAVESREIGKSVLFFARINIFVTSWRDNADYVCDYLGFWLPILARTVARVTGVTDYNIVQNNGMCNASSLLIPSIC